MSAASLLAEVVTDAEREVIEWRRWACGKVCDCAVSARVPGTLREWPVEASEHQPGCRYLAVLTDITESS